MNYPDIIKNLSKINLPISGIEKTYQKGDSYNIKA